MRKILYSFLSLFVIWFASTACFPIYVGTSRPQLAPCQSAPDAPRDPNIPCIEAETGIEAEPTTSENETVSL